MNRSIWLSLILGLLAFGLDRGQKFIQIEVVGWTGGEYHAVTGFFDYVLVWNPGISYGLLGSVPLWGIAAISAVALAALGIWWWRAQAELVRAGLALCIGGALSNAVDRWRYGAVADFFHFYWQAWSFYIFNLADAAITLGVMLLVLDLVGIGRRRPANAM